ncbi:GGDEF domain-containing protein [Ensifer adhaerens]|uniref:GGDEF domain-containing protein n=1 Tax=Ensifer adhaerens TaxID=106592 RepID=UPI0023A9C113|nr:GGDEF domain-containing protein [Ensifer adhaerens]WDZ78916.1 GGDEF domain-containing protein [Ensifer adhaerens]
MGGAISLLAVNFIIAQIFTAAFLTIAAKSRQRRAALWCGAGFAVASLAAVCEAIVPFSSAPRPFAIGAFACMLGGFCLLRFGLGLFYQVPVRWPVLGVWFVAGVALDMAIYDLPRGTWQHAIPYQMPFFLIQLWTASVVLRSGRRSFFDWLLFGLLALCSLYYLVKIYAAVAAGSGATAQDYVSSPFALISQALGAMLIVGAGLAMLGVMVKDIVDDVQARSEIDLLSGLYNRRGFMDRVIPLLHARATQTPGTLILADLDRFKLVNDTYGHLAGDEVIRRFARVLMDVMPNRAVAGRLGGEEFAVFLPCTDLSEARVVAHGMRAAIMSQQIVGLPEAARVTASFGVTAVGSGEALDPVMQRADMALYSAKANGRNRVECTATPTKVVNPAVPQWVARP